MKTLLAVAAAAAVALALACPGETTCDYPPAAQPTGDPNQDVIGCWQGLGANSLGQDAYSLVVYEFFPPVQGQELPDWREIQQPNGIYPGGNLFQDAWRVVDGGTVQTLDLGPDPAFQPPPTFEITPTSLVLHFDFGNLGVLTQPMRRATCTGYGFDDPAVACPTAP